MWDDIALQSIPKVYSPLSSQGKRFFILWRKVEGFLVSYLLISLCVHFDLQDMDIQPQYSEFKMKNTKENTAYES